MNSPAALVAPARHFILALLAATVPLLSAADPARAQTGVGLSTEHVTVDLSVIGAMGGPAPPGATATVAPMSAQPRVGRLMVPGAHNPTSQLHVPVPPGPGGDKITLRPPGNTPKPVSAAPRKPVPAKKPAAAKMPEEKTAAAKMPEEKPAAASTPPEPLIAPPPAPAMPTPPAVAEREKTPESAAKTAAAKPEPAKTEQASTPPAAALKEGRVMQVAFAAEASKLPDGSKDDLAKLAKRLKDNEALRLQLLAYAGGKDLSASTARRLSLSRALSVRSFLIESGIRSTRIDVRALGDKTTEEPVNRVDVNIVER